MVGLVLVSHSRALAAALVGLVRQMASPDVPIAIAAGVGENREEFGTDAVEISEAIQSVDSEDGVLVMMDLGSAILSAQMAVELLPPEVGERVHLCPAPFIEGSLVAGVQSGLGASVEAICREATGALEPKREQVGEAPAAPPPPEQPAAAPAGAQAIELTLINQHGLHARPAAQFVRAAARYRAEVRVTNLTTGKGPVSAASLNALATLGAVQGHQIQISAAGPEAGEALAALHALVDAGFGEPTGPQPAAPEAAAQPEEAAAGEGEALRAVPVSEGIAIGPLYRYQPMPPPLSGHPAEDVAQEWSRLERAIEVTRQAIEQRQRALRSSLGAEQSAIFDAHLLILEDPELHARVRRRIEAGNENAGAAWHAVIQEVATSYRALEDAYLQQRAADIVDIGNQVLFALAGKPGTEPIRFDEPVILFAEDITPTETSLLDMSRVLGILTVSGGPTSHSAILARALGIPAVTGVSMALNAVPQRTAVAMDGQRGLVWVSPSAERRADLEARRQAWVARREQLLQGSHQAAATRDGRRVEVFANIGSAQEARKAVQNGAEGVGLLRTEFMFLTRETAPGEDEQVEALRQIGAELGERPLTVRTLDIGGDKEVPYLQLAPEANPFLGVRAIRLCFNRPELFTTQLRAILRAAQGFHFRVMFPMIATVDEIREARAWLERAHAALATEKVPHAWPVETGMMVEIPSAGLLSPLFAHEVDFFSIGTNDLTQYTLAAERGNPLLAHLADGLHPAVLRQVGEIAAAAHAAGKWVGVCGELGGDPLAAPVLVGLGVDELSLNGGDIPAIKAALREIDAGQAQALARQALQAESAPAVRRLVQDWLVAG